MGCTAAHSRLKIRQISHPAGEKFTYHSRLAQRAKAFTDRITVVVRSRFETDRRNTDRFRRNPARGASVSLAGVENSFDDRQKIATRGTGTTQSEHRAARSNARRPNSRRQCERTKAVEEARGGKSRDSNLPIATWKSRRSVEILTFPALQERRVHLPSLKSTGKRRMITAVNFGGRS